MPVVSIVIPTCNRLETLRRTIAGYLDHEARASCELLVVDDGSTDGTWEYLTGLMAGTEPSSGSAREGVRVRALRQDHAGPARARNHAIAHATGTYLLLAGDDVRPAAGLVDGHVAAHEDPGAPRFVLGRTEWDPERPITPAMRHVSGFGGQQFRYGHLRDRRRLGFRYFYSSNLSLRRSVLDGVAEPFDPAFGGAAFEDTDLGYRLMGRAAGIEYRRALVAYHDHPYRARTFAERQYRVGRAAQALFAKHPETAPLFGQRAIEAAITAAGRAGRADGGIVRREIGEAEELLARALERLEQQDCRELDRIGLGYFWYCFAKGVAEWRVGDAEHPAVRAELFARALRCPLTAAGFARRIATEDARRLAALAVRLGGRRTLAARALARLRWRLDLHARELLYFGPRALWR